MNASAQTTGSIKTADILAATIEADPAVIAARKKLQEVSKIMAAAHAEASRIDEAHAAERNKAHPKSPAHAIIAELTGVAASPQPTFAQRDAAHSLVRAADDALELVRNEIETARRRVAEAIANARREEHRLKYVDIANAMLQLGESMETENAFLNEFRQAGMTPDMARFSGEIANPTTLQHVGNWLRRAAQLGVIEADAVPTNWPQ